MPANWLVIKKLTKTVQRVCTLVSLSLLYISSIHACELSARVYGFPPLGIQSSDGNWSGSDIDYYNALLSKVNCKISPLEMPFARALKMTEFGQLDMLMNISRTQEREKYLYFIGPIRDESIVLATDDNFPFELQNIMQIAEVDGLVGLQRGIFIGEEFNSLVQSNALFASKILSVSDNTSLIGLLNKGRIVAFFEELTHLSYQIEHNSQFKKVIIQPLIVYSAPVYMAFSKKSVSKVLIDKLRVANEQLINEHVYRDIDSKYNNMTKVQDEKTSALSPFN